MAAFVKKDILDLPDKFFDMTRTGECTREMYVRNYDKDMDLSLKKVAAVYHPDKHQLTISLETNMSDSNNIFLLEKKVFEINIRHTYTITVIIIVTFQYFQVLHVTKLDSYIWKGGEDMAMRLHHALH